MGKVVQYMKAVELRRGECLTRTSGGVPLQELSRALEGEATGVVEGMKIVRHMDR